MLDPARVAIVVPTIPPHYAGGGWRAFAHAKSIAASGQPTEIISSTFNGERHDNLIITTFDTSSYGASAARLALFWRALTYLRATPPALLHFISCYTWSQIIMLAARVAGVPYIVETTLLGTDDPVALRSQRLGELRYQLFVGARRYISISPALDVCCEQVGLPAAQRHILANGVDTQRFAPLDVARRAQGRAAQGWAPDEAVALYVGVISRRKRVHCLIEAFAAVVARAPRARLVLVGPPSTDRDDEEYHRELVAQIARAGLTERVELRGLCEQPEVLMQLADLFVFASSREGFGNVQVEAMSAGLPIIVQRLPLLSEFIVNHGVDGYIVDGVEQLAQRWELLVLDPTLRVKIGDTARRKVLNDFSLGAISARYLELYSEVIGS
jgi:teichuronic acid biosynthesis glycosyltransferase TuaC